MGAYRMTDEDRKRFVDDGFLIVRGLFDTEEMALLRQAVEVDPDLAEAEYAVKDRQGGTAKIAIWQGTGDDLYGLVARSERIVNTMERVLGGEVYHWHSKMTIKVPLKAARGNGIRIMVTGTPTAVSIPILPPA